MANAFTKAQFMEPPGSGTGAVPIGAVKAGGGIQISADGVISLDGGSGIINEIVCTNGIQGGGSNPQVFIGLLPPTATTIGGVKTVAGSNISIDTDGVIRSTASFTLTAGNGIILSNVTPQGATVGVRPAGTAPNQLGAVYMPIDSGLRVANDGALTVAPATSNFIGGIKPGTGCSVTADGTLNATGTGGTITGVGSGTGLGGGGSTGAVTLFLRPAGSGAPNNIGGVYAGDNITIEADGRISTSTQAGVLTVTATPGGSIDLTGTATNPSIGVFDAGLLSTGVVRLVDSITSTQTDGFAATPNSVKLAADLANTKLPLAGGAMTGVITFTGAQTFPNTVSSGAFTQLGGILVGDTSPPGYAQLPVGADGQVLAANSASPLGVEWVPAGQGTVTNVTGNAPIQVATGTSTPVVSITAATTTDPGAVQLENSVTSISETTAPTSLALSTVNTVAEAALPKAGGTMTGAITFDAGQTFPGTLPLSGGTMTGDITFNAGQTFPGVVQSVGAQDSTINVGGTPENPLLDVAIATTSQLGVVQPDGTTITVTAGGVISSTGGMANPMTTIGDIIYSQSTGTPGTPARLGAGANNTILAINAGMPAWRSSLQLGLLTSAAAASTYAPIDNPTFTGSVTVNAAGGAGANALVVSGGNLVLSTSFTPTSSSSTGSQGELAWDTNYLYFCYAPNTWGRVAVDLTPF